MSRWASVTLSPLQLAQPQVWIYSVQASYPTLKVQLRLFEFDFSSPNPWSLEVMFMMPISFPCVTASSPNVSITIGIGFYLYTDLSSHIWLNSQDWARVRWGGRKGERERLAAIESLKKTRLVSQSSLFKPSFPKSFEELKRIKHNDTSVRLPLWMSKAPSWLKLCDEAYLCEWYMGNIVSILYHIIWYG